MTQHFHLTRRLAPVSLAIAGMLLSASAIAGARDQLDTFTQGLEGLDGNFSQQVFDTNGKVKEASNGTLALEAPRHFRWEYVKPYPQIIVADGQTVWIYEPDLDQVTRRPQGVEEQNSPLAVLIDPSRLESRFKVEEGGTADGLEWLVLAPKDPNDASFSSARLGFRDDALVRMQVTDTLGQATRIDFGAWRKNPAFGPGTFEFSPPEGTDVIGEG